MNGIMFYFVGDFLGSKLFVKLVCVAAYYQFILFTAVYGEFYK